MQMKLLLLTSCSVALQFPETQWPALIVLVLYMCTVQLLSISLLLLQDHVRAQDSSLRSLSLKEFAVMVFQNCPELHAQVVSCSSNVAHLRAAGSQLWVELVQDAYCMGSFCSFVEAFFFAGQH